jgi:hypothetical protein
VDAASPEIAADRHGRVDCFRTRTDSLVQPDYRLPIPQDDGDDDDGPRPAADALTNSRNPSWLLPSQRLLGVQHLDGQHQAQHTNFIQTAACASRFQAPPLGHGACREIRPVCFPTRQLVAAVPGTAQYDPEQTSIFQQQEPQPRFAIGTHGRHASRGLAIAFLALQYEPRSAGSAQRPAIEFIVALDDPARIRGNHTMTSCPGLDREPAMGKSYDAPDRVLDGGTSFRILPAFAQIFSPKSS